MKLQQLRFLCEIVDRELSISNAAAALHTSQPSVSRQIQALEKELGVAVFARSRKRILGLTKPGIEVLQIARRMVRDAENLSQVSNEFTAKDSGDLVITTSHTHARYVLPSVIKKFAAEYPKVRVILRQGNPTQIAEWASSGDADLSISSEPIRPIPNLVLLPCYDHPKVVLTPLKHPLLGKRALTIEELARYPLITYDSEFATHSQVMRAFESRQLKPNIILSATDVDVQTDGGFIAQAFGDVHGVSHHRQYRSALQRRFARFSQTARSGAVQRVFFAAGHEQYGRPCAVIVRRRAASVGKTDFQQSKFRRPVKDLLRIAADTRHIAQRLRQSIDVLAQAFHGLAHRDYRVAA